MHSEALMLPPFPSPMVGGAFLTSQGPHPRSVSHAIPS